VPTGIERPAHGSKSPLDCFRIRESTSSILEARYQIGTRRWYSEGPAPKLLFTITGLRAVRELEWFATTDRKRETNGQSGFRAIEASRFVSVRTVIRGRTKVRKSNLQDEIGVHKKAGARDVFGVSV